MRGAYILAEPRRQARPDPDGDRLRSAVGAGRAAQTEEQGIKTRVVSMPCWELFEEQDQSYRDKVLPPARQEAHLAMEAASPMGWRKWVGDEGDMIGVETYGASAPAEIIFEKYGFTVENVVARASALFGKKGAAKKAQPNEPRQKAYYCQRQNADQYRNTRRKTKLVDA